LRAERALLAARLTAQRLSDRRSGDVLEVTRHLLAVQGQDPRAARLALRARTTSAHRSDVDRALTEERSMVITWANRGTLHLIAAEDEPLLYTLTTPQLHTASNRRLQQLGFSEATVDRGVAAIKEALSDHGPRTSKQLRTAIERAKVPTDGQALIHLLFRATIDGLIVRGPMVGAQHAFALVADWLGERPKVDRDHALKELARRYLRGHGPAGERDLAKWAQLPLRDARAGLNAIASELDQRPDGLVDLKGRNAAPLPPPRLLGPYDPLLLGWSSRAFVVEEPPEIVTVNGIIKAVALIRGRVAGTWAMPGGRVSLNLWESQPAGTARALEREAGAVEAYLS
jgi:uncharacterized protein YcaQ